MSAFRARSTPPTAPADTSMWTLVGANVLALVVAFTQGWLLAELMLIYWAQSVIIGASYVMRIASLEKFSTKNFRINNRPVEPTEKTKRQTAMFFVVHYGMFHFVYLAFIMQAVPFGLLFDFGFIICTGAFALNHAYSYRYHRELDRQGTPNIGTLMFTPYVRIVPMHLTILLGSFIAGSGGLVLFGILKTVADAVMHIIEHRKIGAAADSLPTSA